MKEKWVDRRCCDWDTFLTSLMRACEKLKFPLILINWRMARRDWRRYGMTGAEVVKMQRNAELPNAEYLYLSKQK